jgi:hypothetical protein
MRRLGRSGLSVAVWAVLGLWSVIPRAEKRAERLSLLSWIYLQQISVKGLARWRLRLNLLQFQVMLHPVGLQDHVSIREHGTSAGLVVLAHSRRGGKRKVAKRKTVQDGRDLGMAWADEHAGYPMQCKKTQSGQ